MQEVGFNGRYETIIDSFACAEGHNGTMCAICEKDYYFKDTRCLRCDDDNMSGWEGFANAEKTLKRQQHHTPRPGVPTGRQPRSAGGGPARGEAHEDARPTEKQPPRPPLWRA